MVDRLRRKKALTEAEKEKIANAMIDGYKKMVEANERFTEDGYLINDEIKR